VEFSAYCAYVCVLQASDNSASKNAAASDRRSCDDDAIDPLSFSETY